MSSERHAELARLVLQNVDLDDARRLHPVEHDVAEMRDWLRTMPASFCEKSLTFAMSGPLTPVLHGTSHRRADLEQLDEGVGAGKRLPQIGLRIAP